jgi:putative ABC transport system permease protein
MGAQDISWLDLGWGYLLIIIPILIFKYYETGLVKTTLIAIGRMTLQLYLVGLYLGFIFKLNNVWVNILWVTMMVVIASFTTINRANLNRKIFFVPTMLAMLVVIFSIDFYFLGVVVKLDYLFDARYFIPITGMLIGNSMSNNIVAFNVYFKNLDKNQVQYKFALANGATKNEALKSFIKEALVKSLSPTLATTSVVGLISLPGMMTGQILGGQDPSVAIKYQIMIMITILVSSLMSVILSILLSNRFIFNDMDMPLKGLNLEK